MSCSIIAVRFIQNSSIIVVECKCGKRHAYRIPMKETKCPPTGK